MFNCWGYKESPAKNTEKWSVKDQENQESMVSWKPREENISERRKSSTVSSAADRASEMKREDHRFNIREVMGDFNKNSFSGLMGSKPKGSKENERRKTGDSKCT